MRSQENYENKTKDQSIKSIQTKRKYYLANKEKRKEYSRNYHLNNAEKRADYNKAWSENNREKVREYNRRYRERKKEKDQIPFVHNKSFDKSKENSRIDPENDIFQMMIF